jgi:hypothetical protein
MGELGFISSSNIWTFVQFNGSHIWTGTGIMKNQSVSSSPKAEGRYLGCDHVEQAEPGCWWGELELGNPNFQTCRLTLG